MNETYYNLKLAEIPRGFLKECVDFLRKEFSQEVKDEIIQIYKECGNNWMTEYHFFWGMQIRNLLRTNGFKDDVLPDGNWDDYYIQVIELAVGIRQIEGI